MRTWRNTSNPAPGPAKPPARANSRSGTSLAFAGVQSVKEGFPVTVVIPAKGAGYELEASALMQASKNKDDAKKFLDWTLVAEAADIYGKYKEIVTRAGYKPDADSIKAGLPEDVSKTLLPIDFAKSAKEREAILDRWQKEIGR